MPVTNTYGLTHLAVAVSDLNKTMQFYRQVFDMEVMYHEADFLQMTTPGCNDILVFERKDDSLIGKAGGIGHFGFRLRQPEDVSTIRQKILNAGGEITSEGDFVPGSPYIFFKDPDGYLVEVWYELLK